MCNDVYYFSIGWLIDLWCLTPLSATFQLYHGDPERIIDHWQVTGKLYHLRCESSAPFIVIGIVLHLKGYKKKESYNRTNIYINV